MPFWLRAHTLHRSPACHRPLYTKSVGIKPHCSLPPCRRVSYSQERHLFHIVVKDGITFLCMADEVTRLLSPLCIC